MACTDTVGPPQIPARSPMRLVIKDLKPKAPKLAKPHVEHNEDEVYHSLSKQIDEVINGLMMTRLASGEESELDQIREDLYGDADSRSSIYSQPSCRHSCQSIHTPTSDTVPELTSSHSDTDSEDELQSPAFESPQPLMTVSSHSETPTDVNAQSHSLYQIHDRNMKPPGALPIISTQQMFDLIDSIPRDLDRRPKSAKSSRVWDIGEDVPPSRTLSTNSTSACRLYNLDEPFQTRRSLSLRSILRRRPSR